MTPTEAHRSGEASGDPAWAEINVFSFYVPHHNLHVGIYVLLRPALAVAAASVFMNSRDTVLPWRAEYSDTRSHLPVPETADLDDLRLDNGLHIRSTRAGATRYFSYYDGCGTGFEIGFDALMAPFDAFDPTCNPLAPTPDRVHPANPVLNYEQTGRFVGNLRLRGQPIKVDCVSTLNRSRGLRRERGQQPPATPNTSWLHAHFGDDLALHATMLFDQRCGGTDLELRHGYVLSNGAVYGLVGGIGTVERDDDLFARRIALELTDTTGATHRLTGQALTRFLWPTWPNMISCTALTGWQHHDQPGRRGHGEVQDFFEIPALQLDAASHQDHAGPRRDQHTVPSYAHP
jgi:hypothetical protein